MAFSGVQRGESSRREDVTLHESPTDAQDAELGRLKEYIN